MSLFLLIFLSALVTISSLNCGVRGDPLPPEVPTELGRGRPNYKRATQGLELEEPEKTEASDDEENPDEEF